jgi:hypothetical protein
MSERPITYQVVASVAIPQGEEIERDIVQEITGTLVDMGVEALTSRVSDAIEVDGRKMVTVIVGGTARISSWVYADPSPPVPQEGEDT